MREGEISSAETDGAYGLGFASTLFIASPRTKSGTQSWSESIDSFLADIARMSSGLETRATPNLSEGHVVAGRYELRRTVGSGTHGVVWVAQDAVAQCEVALKLLVPASADGAARIRAEVASLRSLRDVGAVTLLDEGLDEGFVFIVMPLVVGVPFPGPRAPVSWDVLCPLAVGLLHTLAKVHALGIVHRDLKPANVLVGSDGVPVILDFGLSLTTFCLPFDERGRIAGTPAYLAPEQIGQGDVDHRADLYAVGAMLYQSLTGSLPHEAASVRALLLAKGLPPIPVRERNGRIPAHVAETIDALLATNPDERPSSTMDVLRRLTAAPEVLASENAFRLDAELSRDAIQALFDDSDPFSFLSDDAADRLWDETRGQPEEVRRTIEDWVSLRVCRWSRSTESTLIVDPLAFDRLEARRLLEPLHAASVRGDAALLLARSLAEQGRLTLAAAILQIAPNEGEASEAHLEEHMELAVDIALSDGAAHALDRVLYDLYRLGVASPRMAHLEKLVRAALALGPWTERALDLASEVAPFDSLRLEVARQSLRVAAARRTSLAREEAIVGELADWSARHPDPLVHATHAGWLGRLRYRQGRFAEASELHGESAELLSWRSERATALMYAASAAMEAFRCARANELAEESHAIFSACRHARGRAQAGWILRTLRYRLDEPIKADPRWVQHVSSVGSRELEGLSCMTEAAIAWRSGDFPTAQSLAIQGRSIWGNLGESAGALLIVSALAMVTSPKDAVTPEAVEKLARQAEACDTPGVGLQILGLLGALRTERTSIETQNRLAAQVDPTHWGHRIDVMSIDEARARLAKNT